MNWNVRPWFTAPDVTAEYKAERESKQRRREGSKHSCGSRDHTWSGAVMKKEGQKTINTLLHKVLTTWWAATVTHPLPSVNIPFTVRHLMVQRYSVCISYCLKQGQILFSCPWKIFETNIPNNFIFQSLFVWVMNLLSVITYNLRNVTLIQLQEMFICVTKDLSWTVRKYTHTHAHTQIPIDHTVYNCNYEIKVQEKGI